MFIESVILTVIVLPRTEQSGQERRLAVVREEHAAMLSALHTEVETLKNKNRGRKQINIVSSFLHKCNIIY